MMISVTARMVSNYPLRKINFQKTNSQPYFTGVQISDEAASSGTSIFQDNYNDTLEKIKDKYKAKKEAITGWFKKRKLRKIEHEEGIVLQTFQNSQEEFIKAQDKIIESQKAQLELLKKNNASLDEIIDLKTAMEHQEKIKQKSIEIAEAKSQKQGFDSIGGYEIEKNILYDNFIAKLAEERAGGNVNLPGCILFFGPNGNGKTTFAKAFANSSACRFPKSIKGSGLTKEEKQQSFLKRLIEAMSDAEEKFSNDRIRTILLVDEFDEYANKESSIRSELTSLLEQCSELFHCTVFATTNNPLDIAEELRNDKRMPIKVFLSPPDFDNTVSVLAHYLKDYSHDLLNYDELAQAILSVLPDAAFNNSQIEEICNNAYENAIGKISQDDIIYQIQITEPGITKEDLLKFENEKSQINTQNRSSVL